MPTLEQRVTADLGRFVASEL